MLTPKQELFCYEYIKDKNATTAYIRAGYSAQGARQNASLLLTNHYIRAKINELLEEQFKRLKVDVDTVLKGLLKIAESDLCDAFDEDNRLKPIKDMPEPFIKAIASIEIEELYGGRGNDRKLIGYTKKIRLLDKIRALELLGKHLKLFTDVHEIPGLENLAEQIKAARKRAGICREE